MELNEIRKDLKDIKYYYSHKEIIDESSLITGNHTIIKKAKLYNSIMVTAPTNLYLVYVSLYTNFHTQESLSNKLGYSTEYIQMLNKQVLKSIQKNMYKKDN